MTAMMRSLATDVARPLFVGHGWVHSVTSLYFTLLGDGDFEIFRHAWTARCTTIAVKLGVKKSKFPFTPNFTPIDAGAGVWTLKRKRLRNLF